jgi:hypothetical protein
MKGQKLRIRNTLVGLLLVGTAFSAQADMWGCEVLLCLANPAGPMAVKECVRPISRLWKHLAKGRAFPTCTMAKGPHGSSYAQPGHSYYDPCPEGTSALDNGAYAIQGTTLPHFYGSHTGTLYTGIGNGDGLTLGHGDDYSPLPGKVCVAKKLGTTMISVGGADSGSTYSVGMYDKVVVMDPAGSPRIIDVYIDDKLFRRVRW